MPGISGSCSSRSGSSASSAALAIVELPVRLLHCIVTPSPEAQSVLLCQPARRRQASGGRRACLVVVSCVLAVHAPRRLLARGLLCVRPRHSPTTAASARRGCAARGAARAGRQVRCVRAPACPRLITPPVRRPALPTAAQCCQHLRRGWCRCGVRRSAAVTPARTGQTMDVLLASFAHRGAHPCCRACHCV